MIERAEARGKARKKPRQIAHIRAGEKAFAKVHKRTMIVCDVEKASADYVADDRKKGRVAGLSGGPSTELWGTIEAVEIHKYQPRFMANKEQLSFAEDIFAHDRFHVMQLATKKVDTTRGRAHTQTPVSGDGRLRTANLLCTTSKENLNEEQRSRFEDVSSLKL